MQFGSGLVIDERLFRELIPTIREQLRWRVLVGWMGIIPTQSHLLSGQHQVETVDVATGYRVHLAGGLSTDDWHHARVAVADDENNVSLNILSL